MNGFFFHRWHGLALSACPAGALVLLLGGCAGTNITPDPAADHAPTHAALAPRSGPVSLKVTGTAGQTVALDTAALQALPSSTETVGTVTYTGVRLWAVLNASAAAPAATSARLSLYVMATGSDGYQALLSWGEIDPEFGNRHVLIAYSADGRALGNGEGLRLIVPGDTKRGRSVRSLNTLGVFSAAPR